MPQYRFHGKFVTASRASQLSHLKGAQNYLTATPTRSEQRAIAAQAKAAEHERRSEAMRRVWEARRARETAEAARRSEAARRGWEARRARETAEAARRSEAARRGWELRRAREAAEAAKRAFPYLPERIVEPARPPEVPVIDYSAEGLRDRLKDIAGKAEDISGVIPPRVSDLIDKRIEGAEESIGDYAETGDVDTFGSVSADLDRLDDLIDSAAELEMDWDLEEVTDQFIEDNMLDDILDVDEEDYEEAA